MVQSLGISLGNANSYVAAGRGGGIEILLNEYSNRSTPSMVAFNDQCRSIGVDASSNFFMNIENTIYDLMVLLGRPYKDLNLQAQHPNHSFKIEEAPDGQALVVVKHLGRERKFTVTQVVAMLLTKLRAIANGTDCVLSCPQFYTEAQKAALAQAALIAGLNPLQIISDMSAVVLNYAYYRTSTEDSHRFIAFINFGQSNLQTVIAWLSPKEDVVRILAAESEPVGGRDFDKVLAEYFMKNHSLNLNPKQHLKLVSACEKLKRLLSANANEIPINVESLISEDRDFTARIDRSTFESISQPLLGRIEACFSRTLQNANTNFVKIKAELAKFAKPDQNSANTNNNTDDKKDQPESDQNENHANADEPKDQLAELKLDLQAVEMVGGSIRIPAVKQLVQNVFSLVPSTTLNTDEAVARGCVLHCATLHPGVKVKREVKILNSETFSATSGLSCDKDLRRIELELIDEDRKYRSRTEARNNLEEFIYSERAKLQDGDEFLSHLESALDWLFSDEGEDAPEEEYNIKIGELKRASEARLSAKKASEVEQQQAQQQQQQQQQKQQSEEQQQQDEQQQGQQQPDQQHQDSQMEVENNKA